MGIVRVLQNLSLSIPYHGNIPLTMLTIKYTLPTTIPTLSVTYVLCMKKLRPIILLEIFVKDPYFAKP